jgi:hypothetical protein
MAKHVHFFFKTKASPLVSYLDEGLAISLFFILFSLENEGFLLWLCILMKASYFGFVFWWMLLTLASYFGFIFWWLLHTLTSYFDEGFVFLSEKRGLHTWLRILTKLSLPLYFDEGNTLTSYLDEGFFDFVFWWRLHTLTLYFDEGFIFALKNEGFTLWVRILMKVSFFLWKTKAWNPSSYFDEAFLDSIFWWRQQFDFVISMKVSLASYFDEGFTLWVRISTKVSFFLWKRLHIELRILAKVSLASYFGEGFTLWVRISMKVSFFLWKMKASHLTSYFDEAIFALAFWRRQHFDFVFRQRFLWLCILTKASHFDFMFWWRSCFFSEKWRLHTWLCILTKVSLGSYFDKGNTLTSYFEEGFVFSLKNEGFLLLLRISMKVSLASYFDEGFFGFVFWWRQYFDFIFRWRFHFFSEKWRLLTFTSYFDECLFGFIFWQRLHILLIFLEPVIVVLTKLTIAAWS